MRHLFYVHSSITRLVAGAIIAHEQLPPADCYYVTDRGVAVDAPTDRKLDVSDWHWQSISGIRQNYAQLGRLDRFLESRIGRPFQFYPPHHITDTVRAVLSHSLAQAFAYAEEGIGSYSTTAQLAQAFPPVRLNAVNRLTQWLKFRGRIPARSAFFQPADPRFQTAYALHPAAFPDLPRREVLPLPFPPAPELAHVRHVWTPSPLAEFRVCSAETQLALTEGLVRCLVAEDVAKLHVKYHPRQLRPDGMAPRFRVLFARYADQLAVVELAPTVSLESLAVSSEATFYTAASSAGFYALLCGCRVSSYASDLITLVPAFQATMDRMPAYFTDHINHIDLAPYL